METPAEYAHIKGWGIDADPRNDPTYPMKQSSNAEHSGYNWERPSQQVIDTEVHHSIERPNISAVYGTSVEPTGLSGMIRRAAFHQSENEYGHWLPLLLADRVNVVEGILDDVAHGHIPNIYVEKGLRADWEYDRENLLTKVAIGVGIVTLAVVYLRRQHND